MIDVLSIPHREARDLLASGAPVYLAVDPVEYHGPHLSLRNDALLSAGAARDLAARLEEDGHGWPFLVAPGPAVGCDVVPGPGAVETPYRVVRRLVLDACAALADLGARRVVLLTFHGGPHHNNALQAGVRLLEGRGVAVLAPMNVLLAEMLALDAAAYAPAWEHVQDPAERAALEQELREDFHAGFFETSLALHWAGDTVAPDYVSLPPCPPVRPARPFTWLARLARALGAERLAGELGFAAVGAGWYALRPFLGYTGRPALATPRAGAFFAARLLDLYHAHAREVFAGRARSPRPIMTWLPALTLGGRAGHPHVPPGEHAAARPAVAASVAVGASAIRG